MLIYVNLPNFQNKDLEPALQDLGDNEKMKESGFIIPQEIPKHSWMIRRMEAAPNRYGIKPGRHWDGVDRSTGELIYFSHSWHSLHLSSRVHFHKLSVDHEHNVMHLNTRSLVV